MSSPRTSKSLAERIDISYWKQPHPLRRWKWIVSWIASALAVLWLVWHAVLADQRIYQSGPLSATHAMVEMDCVQCHTESWQPVLRLVTGNSRHRSVPDAACTRCHAGPIHHQRQIAADVPHCAECHREHRGRVELARVPDSRCVACHGDLKTSSGEPTFHSPISSFETSHPEVAVLRLRESDQAAIKLNHALHLKSEGVMTNEGQSEVLSCDSCHRPDAERRLMQPIVYETHCSRCHSNALVFDMERFADRPAPHEDPEIVRAVVRERYTEFLQQQPEQVASRAPQGSERRIAGRPTGRPASKAEWDWIGDRADAADRVLFEGAGGCHFCHEVSRQESWRITPPAIPDRWLSHSVFRHDSHRMRDCTSCHAAATSTHTSDVLLPSIESCRECHGPSPGARTDCVECHVYHDQSRVSAVDELLSTAHHN